MLRNFLGPVYTERRRQRCDNVQINLGLQPIFEESRLENRSQSLATSRTELMLSINWQIGKFGEIINISLRHTTKDV